MKHLFVICAYKESEFLGECIASLKKQTVPTDIIMCTATPSPYLENMARENGIPYYVHDAKPDIAGDWNFALETCKSLGADYATIAHQDDIYLPEYAEHLQKAAAEDQGNMLIFFSDYGEQRNGQAVTSTFNLNLKRVLLWRMYVKAWQSSRFARHRTLALGDPISCPTVTYHLNKLPLPLFESGMTTNLDWQTWEKLSLLPGRFYFDPKVLMLHRIHAESTTSKVIASSGRTAQDLAMFCKFWPKPIARVLTKLYAGSEKSNNL